MSFLCILHFTVRLLFLRKARAFRQKEFRSATENRIRSFYPLNTDERTIVFNDARCFFFFYFFYFFSYIIFPLSVAMIGGGRDNHESRIIQIFFTARVEEMRKTE